MSDNDDLIRRDFDKLEKRLTEIEKKAELNTKSCDQHDLLPNAVSVSKRIKYLEERALVLGRQGNALNGYMNNYTEKQESLEASIVNKEGEKINDRLDRYKSELVERTSNISRAIEENKASIERLRRDKIEQNKINIDQIRTLMFDNKKRVEEIFHRIEEINHLFLNEEIETIKAVIRDFIQLEVDWCEDCRTEGYYTGVRELKNRLGGEKIKLPKHSEEMEIDIGGIRDGEINIGGMVEKKAELADKSAELSLPNITHIGGLKPQLGKEPAEAEDLVNTSEPLYPETESDILQLAGYRISLLQHEKQMKEQRKQLIAEFIKDLKEYDDETFDLTDFGTTQKLRIIIDKWQERGDVLK